MRKNFFFAVAFSLTLAFLLGGIMTAPLQANAAQNPIQVEVDGKVLTLDVPPVTESGRTLVPIRAIVQAIGGTIKWNPNGTITVDKEGNAITLKVGSKEAYKNQNKVVLDVPAKVINGRTMVPLRFVGEALGLQVGWNSQERKVTVLSGSGGGTAGQSGGQAPTKTADPKTLEGAAYKLLQEFLNQYQGKGFMGVVSVGNTNLYRKALTEVTVIVDTTLSAKAKYDPKGRRLILSKDPLKIVTLDVGARRDWGETVWHELTHRIEDSKGDIGIFDDADYAERNVDYMTHVINSLHILEMLETKAGAGAPKDELQRLWDMFLRKMEEAGKLPSPAKYPPDLKKLESWTGFKVQAEDIRKFYASGACGEALKQLFNPTVTWTGTWSTNWGQMVLTQTGDTVTGNYTWDNGKITGKVVGNKLVGTWSEAPSYSPPNDAGDFEFTMSADGKSLSGVWRYGSSGGWSGDWTGTKN